MYSSGKVFHCIKCGECCRASPISILPHELSILKRLAEKHRIRLEVGFDYTVYDSISRVNIVLTYYIRLREDGSCPFLTEEGLCTVHYEYKPLICRAFPYVPAEVKYYYNPFTKTLFHRTTFAVSKACPILKRLKVEGGRLGDGLFLKRFLRRQMEAAREFDSQRARYMTALSYLWKSGVIDLKFNVGGVGLPVNAYTFIRQYLPTFVPAARKWTIRTFF